MEVSVQDLEILKTIAICLVPVLLSICTWFLIAHFADYKKTRDTVVSIDKSMAVVVRDVEYLVHDQKMQWQRLDDLRDKFFG